MSKRSIEPADVVPWVAIVLAAVGAVAKAVLEVRAADARLEMQKQQMEFMREMAAKSPAFYNPQAFMMPGAAAPQLPHNPAIPRQ
jgi:hypothetical protein